MVLFWLPNTGECAEHRPRDQTNRALPSSRPQVPTANVRANVRGNVPLYFSYGKYIHLITTDFSQAGDNTLAWLVG